MLELFENAEISNGPMEEMYLWENTNDRVVYKTFTLGVVRVASRRRRKCLRHRKKHPDRRNDVGDETGSRNMAVITATGNSTASPYSQGSQQEK